MRFGPGARKLALAAHVASAVGWIGAVVVFLGLAIIGIRDPGEATVRGVYLVMEPAARLVLVPLAVLSLLTGTIQSLGTRWGLIRHYWVIFKLLINIVALLLLLAYMRTFDAMARVAGDGASATEAVRSASPVIHAVLALLALVVALVLAIWKPRGMTRWGWERARREGGEP